LAVFVLWQVGLLRAWVNPISIGSGPIVRALETKPGALGASGKAGAAQGGSGQVRICATAAECVNAR